MIIKSLFSVSIIVIVTFMLVSPTNADDNEISVQSSQITSKFPEGILFHIDASSNTNIIDIRVRFKVGQRSLTNYDRLDFTEGNTVNGKLLFRTNTADRYIPPGTPITYIFEIENAAGHRFNTKPQTFIYYDSRFDWEEISESPITVAYHGPVKRRAELILNSISETLEHMGPLLGVDTSTPIRVTMYNNQLEMMQGLPPRSISISRELITEGQAHPEEGVLLILGSGSLTRGTASHEAIHILVHRATDNPYHLVPAWLNEGLAEYGNLAPGFSYKYALEFAIATNQLIPLMFITTRPSTAEDVIIFYGQSSDVVRFLVDNYGDQKLREFLIAFKSGLSIDDALFDVYEFDLVGLDRNWRMSIGAPPYIPREESYLRPTSIPAPTLAPYSLTPHPQKQPTQIESPMRNYESTQMPSETNAQNDTKLPTTKGSSIDTESTTAGGGCGGTPRHGEGLPLDISWFALAMLGLGLTFGRHSR